MVEASPRDQYFAEGATGFFHTEIGVLNAGTAEDALNIRMYPEHGAAAEVLTIPMPRLTRRTLDINDLLGAADGVATHVALCCNDFVATRRMTWGAPVYGSTLTSGITMPWFEWYFAEGATSAFSLYYVVQNVFARDAKITLTHLPEGGGPPVVQHAVLPAFTRRTFPINEVPGLEMAAVSTVITSDEPIVAERAMFLNSTGRLWEGGTIGRGATSPDTSWSFAEGATGFFHTYLQLGNFADTDAAVTVRYQLPDGSTFDKTYDVARKSRRTVDVNGEDARLEATSVGMTVTSTTPIVAERAMWWGTPFYEGSISLGSTEPGTKWGIGEGIEGGATGASTFVLVSNATDIQGTVRFTVVYDDGTRDERDYALVPHARLTKRIGEDFAKARDARFSVIVQSLTQGMTMTVESAEYHSTSAFGEAGDSTTATRIR